MELNKIKFRNGRKGDISCILEIEHSSFSRYICESQEVFLERINVFPEGFRVMEYDGKVIGYLSSEIWVKPSRYSYEDFRLGHSIAERHDPKGGELYISSMGILPEYRSYGLGKLLFGKFIRYAAKEFSGVTSVVLIVSEKWLNARRVYQSEGFTEINKIKEFFHYNDVKPFYEDGIVMRRKLSNGNMDSTSTSSRKLTAATEVP